MDEKIHLSVIVPAYNEEKRIPITLLEVDKYLSAQKYTYEIIVVNDGSKDNTVKVVENLKKLIKNLKIIDNQENHGKGYVVKQGMLAARGLYRLFMDADNSTSIEHIDKFWPYFKEGYSVVIGSIEVEGAKIEEGAAWYRRFLGKLSKYLIRIIAGIWEIRDSQRGFKCFLDRAAEAVFSKQTVMRFGFDIEVLCLAKKMGFKIKEVAVDWHNPGESKVGLGAYFKTLFELIKIKYNLVTDKYGFKQTAFIKK